MTTPRAFDPSNRQVRKVITPDGEGELLHFDDMKNPTMAIVAVQFEGEKLRRRIGYDISELQEVEK